MNNLIMYAYPSGNFPVLACILAATALVGLGLTIGGVASDNSTLTAIGLGITGIAALGAGGLAIARAVATSAGWRNIIILCFILGLLNGNKNY